MNFKFWKKIDRNIILTEFYDASHAGEVTRSFYDRISDKYQNFNYYNAELVAFCITFYRLPAKYRDGEYWVLGFPLEQETSMICYDSKSEKICLLDVDDEGLVDSEVLEDRLDGFLEKCKMWHPREIVRIRSMFFCRSP